MNNNTFDIHEIYALNNEAILKSNNNCEVLLPENKLWRAVIYQYLYDLTNKSRQKREQIKKNLSRMWFCDINNRENVMEICRLGCIDYRTIMHYCNNIIREDKYFK